MRRPFTPYLSRRHVDQSGRQQGVTVIQGCYADRSTAAMRWSVPVCTSLRAQSSSSLQVPRMGVSGQSPFFLLGYYPSLSAHKLEMTTLSTLTCHLPPLSLFFRTQGAGHLGIGGEPSSVFSTTVIRQVQAQYRHVVLSSYIQLIGPRFLASLDSAAYTTPVSFLPSSPARWGVWPGQFSVLRLQGPFFHIDGILQLRAAISIEQRLLFLLSFASHSVSRHILVWTWETDVQPGFL
ncbi:hypothetical protein N657DRAFT_49222 [Parathielavia appendiculata]|uniref:Uncharacterized protein n=1 Tax=Parathielavia appendiculata TaxID=2587402 RepID=A0AAN6U9J7_9PEZI|nr:hypothetical protein N657DRAFT_49222 [Parathielavia appendiculata]